MNVERAQYVLMHKRLLHIARTPAASTGPAVEVRLVQVLTSLLSETGLDIQEAHAFSTLDGYSLDVFVVGGWAVEVYISYYFLTYSSVQFSSSIYGH
ncbi:hypothetical protein MtrunA17_Chr3g0143541 [Medicago truncatula]|uniref:Uncharacterized protein n=1 Tax=Medicago truncatula TaxID=3880 RepID=A0A396J073_MEDTR|nr:hypothetical protein MtrunA17_Chr3g0143541 [Medicago truncatula]